MRCVDVAEFDRPVLAPMKFLRRHSPRRDVPPREEPQILLEFGEDVTLASDLYAHVHRIFVNVSLLRVHGATMVSGKQAFAITEVLRPSQHPISIIVP
jgi:hypothetical protein